MVIPIFLNGGAIPVWSQNMTTIHDQRHEIRLARLQTLASNGQIWNESRWSSISLEECDTQSAQQLRSDGGSMLIVMTPVPELFREPVPAVISHLFSEPFNWHHKDPPDLLGGNWHYEKLPSEDAMFKCFTLRVPGRCRVQIHVWLLLATTTTNAIKLVCLLLTFKRSKLLPLLLTGDAVESFLISPCKHTSASCLLSDAEITKIQIDGKDNRQSIQERKPKRHEGRAPRYYESASYFRWAVYVSS